MEKVFAKMTLTCKTCGKEFEVKTYKNSKLEAFRWAIWTEKKHSECDDCIKHSAVESVIKAK